MFFARWQPKSASVLTLSLLTVLFANQAFAQGTLDRTFRTPNLRAVAEETTVRFAWSLPDTRVSEIYVLRGNTATAPRLNNRPLSRSTQSFTAVSQPEGRQTYCLLVRDSSGKYNLSNSVSVDVRRIDWLTAVSANGQSLARHIDSFKVETNARYAPRDGKTYCNIFMADVCNSISATVPRGDVKWHDGLYYNANRLADWFPSGGYGYGWRSIASEEDAQRFANQGHLVIAIWKNPNPAISGHCAVVRPHAGFDTRQGPRIAQAGSRNYNSTTVQTGFGRRAGVMYYIHQR